MASISALVECRECGEKIRLDHTVVAKCEYRGNDNEAIWCIHYDCPKCGHRHYVQIDNVTTNGIMVEIEKLLAKISKLKKQGRMAKVKSNQIRYNKLKSDLTEIRKQLMVKYHGCAVTNAAGVNIILEFVML